MFGEFGMAAHVELFRRARQSHAELPHRDVLEAEFVALAVDAGDTPEEAARLARMVKSLGSETRVGQEILSIKQA